MSLHTQKTEETLVLAVLALCGGRYRPAWLARILASHASVTVDSFDSILRGLVQDGRVQEREGFVELQPHPGDPGARDLPGQLDNLYSTCRRVLAETGPQLRTSGQGSSALAELLHAFASLDVPSLCRIARSIQQDLMGRRSFLALRVFYDLIAGCFLATRVHPKDTETCRTYVDASFDLLIGFESFPFVFRRFQAWYFKARSLGIACGNYYPEGAILAATWLLVKKAQSGLTSILTPTLENFAQADGAFSNRGNASLYLSTRYFLEGNFIKSINSVYNFRETPDSDLKRQYFPRRPYIFACASAIYLGEYEIALEMLNLGIRHATAHGNDIDRETLKAIKAYVHVFRGDYEKVEEIAGSIERTSGETVLTYADLWHARALICMHWRLGNPEKAFALYQRHLRGPVSEGLIHTPNIVASMMLEIMTDWELQGLGHPSGGNVLEDIERARESPSIMLRNIATRCKVYCLAKHNGWNAPQVSELLSECLRDARFLGSPVQRAKTLICVSRLSLARGDDLEARRNIQEVADTLNRYGCPIIPADLLPLVNVPGGQIPELSPRSHIVSEQPLGKEDSFIIHSASMQNLLDKVALLAPADISILVLGESGVGKEHIARKLHELSGRKGAFVAVNLATIPHDLFESEFCGHEKGSFTGANQAKIGLMEQADGGTLFLDEVGDVPMGIQVKLLRLLQEKTYRRVGSVKARRSNFRLISATNKNLEKAVRDGAFREDLFYRINVFALRIPPLRERQHDVIFIAEFFRELFLKKYSLPNINFSADELRFLTSYSWPGNVRELKNYVERHVFLTDRERGPARDAMLAGQGDSVEEPWARSAGEYAASPPREEARTGLQPFREEGAPALAPAGNLDAMLGIGGGQLPKMEALKNAYVEYCYRLTKGNVCGPQGMAAILGVSKVTVYSWIERLGLKEKYETALVPKAERWRADLGNKVVSAQGRGSLNSA